MHCEGSRNEQLCVVDYVALPGLNVLCLLWVAGDAAILNITAEFNRPPFFQLHASAAKMAINSITKSHALEWVCTIIAMIQLLVRCARCLLCHPVMTRTGRDGAGFVALLTTWGVFGANHCAPGCCCGAHAG